MFEWYTCTRAMTGVYICLQIYMFACTYMYTYMYIHTWVWAPVGGMFLHTACLNMLIFYLGNRYFSHLPGKPLMIQLLARSAVARCKTLSLSLSPIQLLYRVSLVKFARNYCNQYRLSCTQSVILDYRLIGQRGVRGAAATQGNRYHNQ